MALRTVARLYDSYADASAAVRELEAAGFLHDDVSLIGGHRGAQDLAAAGRGEEAGAAGGAAAGATVGTLVGGTAGLLAGLGALAIPGFGPIVAAGWLAAALAGAGIGAATGGILGALAQAGIAEEHAHVYAEGLRRGGTLVLVRAEDRRAAEAERILTHHNPVDMAARAAEYRTAGRSRHEEEAGASPASGMGTAAGVGTTTAAGQMGTRTRDHPRTDAALGGKGGKGTAPDRNPDR